jgi:hypothetical protein
MVSSLTDRTRRPLQQCGYSVTHTMNKRFQVFVSSTYTDLIKERHAVFETLMTMPCIPAGMEWFPAGTEEQWKVIQKVIDDSDFYVLVIGGRYGSITSEGLSYTEKEFDYAVTKIPVLVFCHENPSDIPLGKSEGQPEMRIRLAAFREKALTGRMANFWTTAEGLAGKVAIAVNMAILTQPAIGWVRANQVATTDALLDLNRSHNLNQQLTERIEELEAQLAATRPDVSQIAGLDEKIKVEGTYQSHRQKYNWAVEVSWSQIFTTIAPHLLEPQPEDSARRRLVDFFAGMSTRTDRESSSIRDQDFLTIKVQLMALKLIEVETRQLTVAYYTSVWGLTSRGEQLMFQLRTIKTVHST